MLEYITSKGKALTQGETYENAKNESVVVRYTDVDKAQYEAYYRSLLSEFTVYDEKCVCDNRFATLVTDTHELHLCFYPVLGEMRVIYGKRKWLPPLTAPEATGDVKPTFAQIGLVVGGMLYVAQLSDGSFLIIDSGKKCDEDRDALLEYLYARKPADHEKPRIAAWLISHAHNDHIHLCQEFLLDYGNKVELSLFGYNFPDFETDIINSTRPVETTHALHWQNRMKEILDEHYPDDTRYTMHTGQKLLLPGCAVEILGTWEDFWPETMKTVNQTSFIIRLCFESGKTVMLPCDAWTGQTDLAVKVWGEYLKSDVLQVIHHGLAGGNTAFYERVLPEVSFCPSPQFRFEATEPVFMPELDKTITVVRSYEPSRWLLEHVNRHYHHGKTVTIEMQELKEI